MNFCLNEKCTACKNGPKNARQLRAAIRRMKPHCTVADEGMATFVLCDGIGHSVIYNVPDLPPFETAGEISVEIREDPCPTARALEVPASFAAQHSFQIASFTVQLARKED